MKQFSIDPETGLPALPEGRFWRVRPPQRNVLYVFADVQLRETRTRKTWFGLGKVKTYSVLIDDHPVYADRVHDKYELIRAAQYILNKPLFEAERIAKLKAASNNYGDYPPKKLDNAG